VSWDKVLGCVVCRFHVAAGEKLHTDKFSGAIVWSVAKLAGINHQKFVSFSYWFDNLGSQLREDLLLCSSHLTLGVTNYASINKFSGVVAGEKKISARGVSHFQSFTLLLFCFILFLLASFYQKHKKISSFIVVIFTCLLLVLLEWVLMRTPSCVILLAPITMILSALLLHHLLLRQIFTRLNLLY
jgi:hypothetical protein